MSVIASASDCTEDYSIGLTEIITHRISNIQLELDHRRAENAVRCEQAPAIADEIFRLMLRYYSMADTQSLDRFSVAKLFGYNSSDHNLAGIAPKTDDPQSYEAPNVLAIWLKKRMEDRGLPCGPLIDRWSKNLAWTVSSEVDKQFEHQRPLKWFDED
jgi:hypothetical protein